MAERSLALSDSGAEQATRPQPVVIERLGPAEGAEEAMVRDIRAGLRLPLPSIPCTYLYDDRGSELFEEITRLEEYYQTRTEEALLGTIADEVAGLTRPREVVELGSGVGRKIRMLLDAVSGRRMAGRCTLLDINEAFLCSSAQRLACEYPALEVRGVVGDFTRDLAALGCDDHRLMIFLAGTFGNLEPQAVPGFLHAVASALGRNSWLLVGLDLVKPVAVIERAYNDRAGVTAEFNLNVLRVLNLRLGADFDLGAFEHVAFYDRDHAWIEMRLRATRRMRATVPAADVALELEAGDEIRTEISCKYTRESFARLLDGTGLALRRWFTDPQQLFALALVSGQGPTMATVQVSRDVRGMTIA